MSSSLNRRQLLEIADCQSSSLTDCEKVVYGYLMAKVQHGITGMSLRAFKEVYEPSADLLYMDVKTCQVDGMGVKNGC